MKKRSKRVVITATGGTVLVALFAGSVINANISKLNTEAINNAVIATTETTTSVTTSITMSMTSTTQGTVPERVMSSIGQAKNSKSTTTTTKATEMELVTKQPTNKSKTNNDAIGAKVPKNAEGSATQPTVSENKQTSVTETTATETTATATETTIETTTEMTTTEVTETTTSTTETTETKWTGSVLTASKGTVQGPSGKETYYNLDMTGVISIMRSQGYNSEDYSYWVRDDGVKMFGDYVMCAANLDIRPRGTLIETSLGTAIVCDTGGFANNNRYQVDIAVTW